MFNLEECMNNEFLRPRENSCKWFNNFGVMRRKVYIVMKGKYKILSKMNWANRFRPYKTKQEKTKMWWRMMGVKQELNRFKIPRMRFDILISIMNRFRLSQRVWWVESNKYDTIHIWIDSIDLWYSSHEVRDQHVFFNSLWIDSRFFDTIHLKSESNYACFKKFS